MANELRIRQLSIGGLVEDNPLTLGATTLTSAALAAVSGGVDSSHHLPIVLDPDGVDGAPEVVYVTALTAAASSATIVRAQEGTTARQHVANTPWVHAATPSGEADGSGGGLGLIGLCHYVGADTSTSITSTSMVDIDGTNFAVTFTAPPSGKVLVRVNAQGANIAGDGYIGLRESTTDLASALAYKAGGGYTISSAFRITGLTAGSSHTYKASAKVSAGTGNIYTGPNYGPWVMEVWAVNL